MFVLKLSGIQKMLPSKLFNTEEGNIHQFRVALHGVAIIGRR